MDPFLAIIIMAAIAIVSNIVIILVMMGAEQVHKDNARKAGTKFSSEGGRM